MVPALLRQLRDALRAALDSPDVHDARAPLATLVLAEVAQTDRVHPWMTDEERGDMVYRAVDYLESVHDYRGYEPGIGWRHGVARGAGWIAELGRNPALSDAHTQRLLHAPAVQVVPDTAHAYVQSESVRLAIAALAVAGTHPRSPDSWKAWLGTLGASLGAPAPNGLDAEWLARRHDLGAFLMVLYVGADTDPSAEVQALLPAIRQAIGALP